MPLTDPILKRIEEILADGSDPSFKIVSISEVAGGSINEAYKIDSKEKSFFVKVNDSKSSGMFESEIEGLTLLKEKSDFKIPIPVKCENYPGNSILILEYISSGAKTNNFFSTFGKTLADLHRNSHFKFGLENDNYIASLRQSNRQHQRWISFFVEERLDKQLKLAVDGKKVNASFRMRFEKIYDKLNDLIPEEKPALLHGDLWSGNILSTEQETPCIFDPAVYYGHREIDIAMTKLFGGFSDLFYQSYNEAFKMENNWEERMDIHNLYPLMVHVNLFGGGYIDQVEKIIKKFV
jgi:protein-ribulosamine 3-kinase